MPATLRNSLASRRYRLIQAITMAGAIAMGLLVVNRLVELFREDFFLYYGLSGHEYASLRTQADAALPLTLLTLVFTTIAFATVFVFVWSERRRITQTMSITDAARGRSKTIVVERMSVSTMFDQFVVRTSSFAGLLLSIWLLQTSLERWLSGYGLGIEYVDWRSLLPFASVFGLCVLAGMIVAGVSLIGMRVIHVLEVAMRQILRRRRREVQPVRVRHADLHAARTLRERIGYEIFSRPPPLAA